MRLHIGICGKDMYEEGGEWNAVDLIPGVWSGLANERHERAKYDSQCKPTYQCWIMPLNFLSVERTECRTWPFVRNFVPARFAWSIRSRNSPRRVHTQRRRIDERRMLVESDLKSRAINRRLSRDGEISVSRWIIRSNRDGNCDSGIIAAPFVYICSDNSMRNRCTETRKNDDCCSL